MTAYLSLYSSQFINLRVTFKNSPIHILEKFTFKDIYNAYEVLINSSELEECLILQTCNRVEIYGVGKNPNIEKLTEIWSSLINVSMDEIKSNIVIETGEEAIKHLANLTSGLDSLVIGEDQILGQVKRSIEFSRKNGFSGPNLNVLFDRTIKTGSKVRAATGINKGSMSIGSMAVNLAYEYFDDISEKNFLLVVGLLKELNLFLKQLRVFQYHLKRQYKSYIAK